MTPKGCQRRYPRFEPAIRRLERQAAASIDEDTDLLAVIQEFDVSTAEVYEAGENEWNAALEMAQNHQQFTVNDVLDAAAFDESKRRTVRRVMEAMETHEWIEQYTKGSRYWTPGSKITAEQ